MLTLVPATLWGFADRGLVREGMAADSRRVRSGHHRRRDAGGRERPARRRAAPRAAHARHRRDVVNGEVLLRDGKHTGALPGRLLRGPAARRA